MNNATTDFTYTLFGIAILVISVIIHEVSHGIAAYVQGDKTAQYAGRLTLNPLVHIDPFGSILLPAFLLLMHSPFLIGWAKPVPYNPYNLRNQRWGPAIVGAAGPLSNIALALVFGLMIRFGSLALPPAFVSLAILITLTNLVLAVFNLMPIPPLDGSKVLFSLMPYHWHRFKDALENYGFFLLLIFILVLSPIIDYLVSFLFRLIVGM